jgi:hypothetical protein
MIKVTLVDAYRAGGFRLDWRFSRWAISRSTALRTKSVRSSFSLRTLLIRSNVPAARYEVIDPYGQGRAERPQGKQVGCEKPAGSFPARQSTGATVLIRTFAI